MKIASAAVLALAAAFFALPAAANDYLTGSLGWFDINKQDDESVEFGLEYRAAPWDFGIRPTVGVSATADGSFYGYGGITWDIKISDPLYIIPSFMAGAYHQGDGKDLGGAIEFRSGIEMDYQFANESRIGVALNHISNASIYDKNPGVETVLVNYSYPLGGLFHWGD